MHSSSLDALHWPFDGAQPTPAARGGRRVPAPRRERLRRAATHVALQEEECVRRRRWLDRERFLDLLAVTNLLPGPNSTEMAIHLGRLRAGMPGLVAGGVAFILPSAVLVTLAAAAYARLGAMPPVEIALATLGPAVVVVVADALVRFARQAFRTSGSASSAGVRDDAVDGGAADVAGRPLDHAAPPGIRTFLDLPLVCGRGATARPAP